MDDVKIQRCMNCMSLLGDTEECSVCGYKDLHLHPADSLEPGSVIGKRYLIGNVKDTDGDGFLYIGYDQNEENKVWIKEYVPLRIVRRDENGNLTALSGKEAQYKTFLMDFIELHRTVAKFSEHRNILAVKDFVMEHNTAYVIYEYRDLITLEKYLADHEEKLTWNKAKKMFMPLLGLLAKLHDIGVVHRGISPETILVDAQENLLISQFCIAPARTDNSEIDSKLYPGYTSPEQYSLSSWQSTWTDVYSMAAVLYKVLTGEAPLDVRIRMVEDSLLSVHDIDGTVPQNVSDTITKAMILNVNERIPTVDALMAGLLESQGSNTAIFDPTVATKKAMKQVLPELDAENEEVSEPPEEKKNSRYVLLAMFATGLVLIGVLIFIVSVFLKDLFVNPNSQESSPSSSTTEVVVPSFIGERSEDVMADEIYKDRITFVIEEVYSDEYDVGLVVDQSIEEGAVVELGKEVTLYVSKGSDAVIMPYIVGVDLQTAIKTLTDMNIQYTILERFDNTADENVVLGTSIQNGQKVHTSKDVVTIFVKKKTETPSSSSSESSSSEKISHRDYYDYGDE